MDHVAECDLKSKLHSSTEQTLLVKRCAFKVAFTQLFEVSRRRLSPSRRRLSPSRRRSETRRVGALALPGEPLRGRGSATLPGEVRQPFVARLATPSCACVRACQCVRACVRAWCARVCVCVCGARVVWKAERFARSVCLGLGVTKSASDNCFASVFEIRYYNM